MLAHAENRGKGDAIRSGWRTAPQARWLAFVDADGSAPAAEVVALLARARDAGAPAVFIAGRRGRINKTVSRFWYRRLGSWLFNGWVRCCLHFDLPDTQCGLKVIPASLSHAFVWRENGFAFDLELLARARAAGLPVITQSIAWRECSGSSLGVRAILALFAAAWRLRRLT